MRKTSHDGIDATSITSSIENEIKKAGTNITKIKKSSIKRKVQNFSHESDDGIIEPLLQIDKEKSEIANRSAKYLLNKSKTDSYEKDNKSTESYTDKGSISSVISPTSKIVNNMEKEIQISTSHGTAPLHNYMNTNVFGTSDVSKDIIQTKNSILVEIDGCKPNVYSPNPLIFTTAKIHADGKTKLMEPVQVTPVPILSTIEGSVVKTMTNNVNENKLSNIATKSADLLKNACSKSDINELQTSTAQTITNAQISTAANLISSKAEPLISYLNESKSKSNNESSFISTVKDSGSKSTKNQNMSNLSNNISQIVSTTTSSTISYQTDISKVESCIENSILSKASNALPTSTKVLIGSSKSALSSTSISSKSLSTDKTKENNLNEKKDLPIKVQLPIDLQNVEKSSNVIKPIKDIHEDINDKTTLGKKISSVNVDSQNLENKLKNVALTDSDTSDSKDTSTKSKGSTTGSKKLQRQKNAAAEEITDRTPSNSTLSEKLNIKQDLNKKSIKNNENIVLSKGESQSTISSGLISTSSPVIVSKPTVLIPEYVSKVKTGEAIHLTPLSKNGTEDLTKILNKTSIVTPVSTGKEKFKVTSSMSSVKLQSSAKTAGGKTSPMTTSSKSDVSSSASKPTSKLDCQVKNDSSAVVSTLPAYIVSTSKTKIGSTLTSSTITTSKMQTQKPKNEVVETFKVTMPAQKSERPTIGSSSSNGTKQTNFSPQTKTKSEKNKKDGRA